MEQPRASSLLLAKSPEMERPFGSQELLPPGASSPWMCALLVSLLASVIVRPVLAPSTPHDLRTDRGRASWCVWGGEGWREEGEEGVGLPRNPPLLLAKSPAREGEAFWPPKSFSLRSLSLDVLLLVFCLVCVIFWPVLSHSATQWPPYCDRRSLFSPCRTARRPWLGCCAGGRCPSHDGGRRWGAGPSAAI